MLALAKFAGKRAVEPLIGALTDSELSVRAAAVLALADLGDTRAVEPMIAAFQTWEAYDARLALKGLETLLDRSASNILTEDLEKVLLLTKRSYYYEYWIPTDDYASGKCSIPNYKGKGTEHVVYDSFYVKQLVRQELIRRGLNA